MRKAKERRPHTILHGIALFFSGLLSIALVAATVFTFHIGNTLDGTLFLNPSQATDAQKAKTAAKAEDLAKQVESEGVVLLRNENHTLPLNDEVKRVNVFGWASTAWLSAGSGSGGVIGRSDGLLDALHDAGIETNAKLTDMYRDFQDGREYTATLRSTPEQSSRLYEPSIDDADYYSADLLDEAQAYSDTAFVVFGRLSGESSDMPRQQYKRVAKDGEIVVDKSRTSLDLSSEEEALLAYVGAHYERVVVILNTGNPMGVGALETIDGVDACVQAGLSGQVGAQAIPDLLWGRTAPSGRLTDTWAYDFATAASYANSGLEGTGAYVNAGDAYPVGVTNGNSGQNDTFDRVPYVDYAEGIYLGYKWYETADVEGYWDATSNVHGDGYAGVVQYPFGYGLSYTDFDWNVEERPSAMPDADGTVDVKVKVTNVGDVAGKDVVELYYTAPYTPGGIGKSAVSLAAFAKTKELQPGESETVTLSFDVRDMASYDCYDANDNGFTGYELESGDYELSLRRDAHTVDSAPDARFTLRLAKDVRYAKDAVTGETVDNKFTGEDALDGISVDGSDTGQDVTYLTRADCTGTFPKERTDGREMADKLKETNLYEPSEDADGTDAGDDGKTVVTGARNGLKLEEHGKVTELGYDLGSDADDERWESLLDQMTASEMKSLFTNAYSSIMPVKSVGKMQDKNADGPSQIGSLTGFGAGTGFPASITLAQTWNTDLAREVGRTIGHQALENGFAGWYAPAVNLHRTPFGGRNYEYYGEDESLSGRLCGETVLGAGEAGVYTFVKHFVGNDSENGIYRDSAYTWMTEQTLRETYLEPFRMIVEDYEAVGLMTSYNRLGGVWSGGSHALLTDVLRGEWGFDGAVITDYCDHHEYMNGDHALDAGGTLWMSGMFGGTLEQDAKSPATLAKLREAAKGTLYMQMRVKTLNRDYVEASGDDSLTAVEYRTPGWFGWRQILLLVDVVFLLFAALSIRGLIRDHRIRKSRRAFAAADADDPKKRP